MAVHCTSHDHSVPDPTETHGDVLSSLMSQGFDVESQSVQRFVFRSMSNDWLEYMLEEYDPDLPGLRNDTLKSFGIANRLRTPLRLTKIGGLPVHIVTDEDVEQLFGPEDAPKLGWDEFAARFPNSAGLMRMSRIGLSEDGGQALVFVAVSRGPLDGHGSFYLLERRSGQWKLVDEQCVWIS
jgi:hypothetical protein